MPFPNGRAETQVTGFQGCFRIILIVCLDQAETEAPRRVSHLFMSRFTNSPIIGPVVVKSTRFSVRSPL